MSQVPKIRPIFAGPHTPREWLKLTRNLADLGRVARNRVELASHELERGYPEGSQNLAIALCEITELEECAVQAILWLLHLHESHVGRP